MYFMGSLLTSYNYEPNLITTIQFDRTGSLIFMIIVLNYYKMLSEERHKVVKIQNCLYAI